MVTDEKEYADGTPVNLLVLPEFDNGFVPKQFMNADKQAVSMMMY